MMLDERFEELCNGCTCDECNDGRRRRGLRLKLDTASLSPEVQALLQAARAMVQLANSTVSTDIMRIQDLDECEETLALAAALEPFEPEQPAPSPKSPSQSG
jgi:hypothetical protein